MPEELDCIAGLSEELDCIADLPEELGCIAGFARYIGLIDFDHTGFLADLVHRVLAVEIGLVQTVLAGQGRIDLPAVSAHTAAVPSHIHYLDNLDYLYLEDNIHCCLGSSQVGCNNLNKKAHYLEECLAISLGSLDLLDLWDSLEDRKSKVKVQERKDDHPYLDWKNSWAHFALRTFHHE